MRPACPPRPSGVLPGGSAPLGSRQGSEHTGQIAEGGEGYRMRVLPQLRQRERLFGPQSWIPCGQRRARSLPHSSQASQYAAHRAPPSLGGTLREYGSASLVPRRHLIISNAGISLICLMRCASLWIPCLISGPDILWRIVRCRWIRCCTSAARCVRHRAPSQSSATLRQDKGKGIPCHDRA